MQEIWLRTIMCVLIWGGTYCDPCEEVRGQFCGASSLFLPLCEFQGLNLGSQACAANTFPAAPSCQSKPLSYFYRGGPVGFVCFFTYWHCVVWSHIWLVQPFQIGSCVCMNVCVHLWKREAYIKGIFLSLFILSFEIGSLIEVGSHWLTRLTNWPVWLFLNDMS